MSEKNYTLRYLPIAKDDLFEIADYIQNNLQNPIVAQNTLDKIENAILERMKSPESFSIWKSKKFREYPYRRINVGNYTVWYVVIDDVVEVRRILYSRRDEEDFPCGGAFF